MRGRKCGAEQMMISGWNVEDSTRSRSEKPLVAIAREEVGVDNSEVIEFNMADTVRAIH